MLNARLSQVKMTHDIAVIGLGRIVEVCSVCGAAWQAHGEHRALARLARDRHVAAHHPRELARER
jgi:hypothetical protein